MEGIAKERFAEDRIVMERFALERSVIEGMSMEGRNGRASADMELRRYYRRIRRRRQQRKRLIIAVMLFELIVACSVSYNSIKTSANSGSDMAFKYYTSVQVQKGDTLWTLADEYMDSDRYKDKNAYIAEVRSINHIQEDSALYSGQYITVPYYSEQFIK